MLQMTQPLYRTPWGNKNAHLIRAPPHRVMIGVPLAGTLRCAVVGWVGKRGIYKTADLLRPGMAHFVAGQRELLKILLEALGQAHRLPVIGFFVFPRIPRIKQLARHTGTRRG